MITFDAGLVRDVAQAVQAGAVIVNGRALWPWVVDAVFALEQRIGQRQTWVELVPGGERPKASAYAFRGTVAAFDAFPAWAFDLLPRFQRPAFRWHRYRFELWRDARARGVAIDEHGLPASAPSPSVLSAVESWLDADVA